MLHYIITALLLTVPLLAQEIPSTSSSPETITTPLLVHEYVDLLKAIGTNSDRYSLYRSLMSDQIIQEKTTADVHDIVVEDQENKPMHHLMDQDVMHYCNWKDHGSPTNGIDLEDSTEEKTEQFNPDISSWS